MRFILLEADARELGLVDGDMVRADAPAGHSRSTGLVRAGQAARTISQRRSATAARLPAAWAAMSASIFIGCAQTASPWASPSQHPPHRQPSQTLLRTQHFFQLEGEAEELQPRFASRRFGQARSRT